MLLLLKNQSLARVGASVAVIAFLLCLSCSAPYDNPLDPRSDRFVPPTEPEPQPAFGFRTYTSHVSYDFPNRDTYQVQAEVWVDLPFLIDSASVRYQSDRYYNLSGTATGIWGRAFAESFFGDTLFEKVLGNPFVFKAFVSGSLDSFVLGPSHIVRVIESTPIPLYPNRDTITNPTPTLLWQDFDSVHTVVYPFGYKAEVFFVTSVWNSGLLPDSILSVTVTDTLPDGQYYWTISVIDSFNNISRSKEGRFTIVSASNP